MGLMIDLQPRAGPALVVGGGVVAARKVANLLAGGFAVTVVSPLVARAIREDARARLVERPFEAADIDEAPYAVVFACTDERAVNARVGELAHARRIPVVVADSANESTFYTPATYRDGDLVVGISTTATSPALAKTILGAVTAVLGSRPTGPTAGRSARGSRTGGP